MRIAKCGYEYEQYHAFFPLLPAAVAAVRSLGAPLRALPSHALPSCATTCHAALAEIHSYSTRVHVQCPTCQGCNRGSMAMRCWP